MVKDLSKWHKIMYLTARDASVGCVTAQWLETYGLPKVPIVHANGIPKAELAVSIAKLKNLEIAGAIEDAPQEVIEYLRVLPKTEILVPAWEYNTELAEMAGVRYLNVSCLLPAVTKIGCET
jgi:hypothetical protein